MTDTGNELKKKLSQIQKVFDLKEIVGLNPDKGYIQKYYKTNRLAYSLFHSFSDQVHMGISRDGKYKKSDLLEAARIVEKYLNEIKATRVLELATGRGATSAYLAKKYPQVKFEGIELTQGQLDFAQNKAKKLDNYYPVLGDYHNLNQYPKNRIDIVFVVEALCHSTKKDKVFSEVKKVLKKNGVFIIIDGYLRQDHSKMMADEVLASKLTEIGMAVNEFETYQSLINKVERSGFRVIDSEDVSHL